MNRTPTGFGGLDRLIAETDAVRQRMEMQMAQAVLDYEFLHPRDRQRFAAMVGRFVEKGERAREVQERPDTPALQAYFR